MTSPSKLPAGMTIDKRIFRQADFIEIAIHNVQGALRDGGLLVVVIVLLFLANVRATFITLTAIPLSLVVTVLVMKSFGATINTMTLGGMAIAIGALVDDAVILVENVFRRLRVNSLHPEEKRKKTMQVIFDASIEIQKSIVFATLIIALVFLPIFFLSGVEGRLLKPLGLAYIVSLGASLLVALTVSPVLCHLLLPAQPRGAGRPGAEGGDLAEIPLRENPDAGAGASVASDRARRRGAGAGAGLHVLHGPLLPARVQRRHADAERGHAARHVARTGQRVWQPDRAHAARASGSDRRGAPPGPRRAGRARPGRGVLRD